MTLSHPSSATFSNTPAVSALQFRSARHLKLDGVSVLRGTRRVLQDVNLTVSPGETIGLIGANGAGKSTLLSVITGSLDAQSATGTIDRPDSLGALAQELEPAPATSILDVIDRAVAPIRAIGDRLEAAAMDLSDPNSADRYELALIEAEQSGLWQLDARINAVLAGLGLADFPKHHLIAEMSGGQRRRLSLASLLLEQPTAILLDEPTNHLDDDALGFLEQEFRSWRGPVLFASHDRTFLDAVATGIVDLDFAVGPGGPTDGYVQGRRYTGGFSAYLGARDRERTRWQNAYEAEQRERARLQQVLDVDARTIFHTTQPRNEARITAKFEADRAAKTVGNRLRQARNQLAALDRTAVPKPPAPLRFVGFAREQGGSTGAGTGTGTGTEPGATQTVDTALKQVTSLQSVSVSGRLNPVSLEIEARSRILVEGPNGAGKSTLLAILAGAIDPDSGTATRFGTVGLLAQYDTWDDLSITATAAYRSALRDPDHAPSLTALGLLDEKASELTLAELSYGQRRRVALAQLVAEPPELLLLDEPTNHLALALAEELEQEILDYPGAVVIASHDRWLRDRWQGESFSLSPAPSL
ncbi:MAG: ABC-F family ATP-binding cassette domain-containing protein [Gulosibacter sp.]|uniref:ABC-F family ATP-binding cassette domain-containing protein n=1 Tax=Gulosibacter sp. TaxID=2817531 RepID=UPI003F914882